MIRKRSIIVLKQNSLKSYPFTAIGSDMLQYYVRFYERRRNHHPIVAEAVCCNLAKAMGIKAVEMAFMENTINYSLKCYPKDGAIGIGVQIRNSYDEIDNTHRHRFRYSSSLPSEKGIDTIIRTGLFDLHLNVHRNRENYRMLVDRSTGHVLVYGFDNGFDRLLNSKKWKVVRPNLKDRFIRTTRFNNIVQHVDIEYVEYIIDDYFHRCIEKLEKAIHQTVADLPENWKYRPKLESDLLEYLTSVKRLGEVRDEFWNYVNYLKS